MVVTRRQLNRDACESQTASLRCPTSREINTSSRRRSRSTPRRMNANHANSSANANYIPGPECVVAPAPEARSTESRPSLTFSQRSPRIRCCCFYISYILVCVLLTIVVHTVSTSYSRTLSQIEDLAAEINTLRNEILINQKYGSTPSKPPAIDSKFISNDLIQILDGALARENQKLLNELREIKAILEQMKTDNSKSYDELFDLILTKMNAMQRDLSKDHLQKTTLSLTSQKPGNSPQVTEDRVDYAAESLGGEIHSTDNTQLLKMYYFGSIFGWIENTPRMVIQPSIIPGECYGFAGQTGSIVIKLMGRVFIDSVTIGHIPKELSPSGDLNTAPRNITVTGLATPDDPQPTALSTFEYDINKNEMFQTFPVITGIFSFQFVRFNFTSNYGNLNHTCVYRIRVHGKLDVTNGR